jgi:hypothetical protein
MKRPTQVDVARIAGVSRATVSFVINDATDGRVPISEETRQRVLKAVEELGYIPDTRAQALRSGDTKTIGLIIPDMHNPHFWETVNGIGQGARRVVFPNPAGLESNIKLPGYFIPDRSFSVRRGRAIALARAGGI